MRRFLRENSLTLVFLSLFLAALVLQAIAGHSPFNDEQDRVQGPHLSLLRYVFSSSYGVSVMENWQSEYLQFTLFILLTVWLLQKGSPESKELDRAGRETDSEQLVGRHADEGSPRRARVAGVRRTLYENSLVIVMGGIWVASWLLQSLTGATEYNAERLSHHQAPVSWLDYLASGNSAHPRELAIRIPRCRLDGHPRRVPAPTRITRVQARRHPPPRHGRRRLSPPPSRADHDDLLDLTWRQ